MEKEEEEKKKKKIKEASGCCFHTHHSRIQNIRQLTSP